MIQSSQHGYVIGVDVGGTKGAAGFVDRHGEIMQHTPVPMNPRGSAEEGLAAVTSAIDALLKMAPEERGAMQHIGICVPGPLDPHTGAVLNPLNVSCWRNFSVDRPTSGYSCTFGSEYATHLAAPSR